jgi:hypothetical protein
MQALVGSWFECAWLCLFDRCLVVAMVRGSCVLLLLGALERSSAQSAWQAGEPIAVNIDYDVPAVSAEAGAMLVQRNAQLEARLVQVAAAQRFASKGGFSAASVRSGQRLRGDSMPVEQAEVVVHVPSPSYGPARAKILLAGMERQLGVLSGLAAKQRAQEDRALNVATDLAKTVASASRRQSRGHTISELVVEAEVATSHASGSSREVADLVAEVEAGGVVARRALKKLLVFATGADAQGVIVAAGAARAAAALLKRSGTDEENRALAVSLLTLLSGMPVAAEVSDEVSGADGHVEIILPRPSRIYGPDAAAMQLSFGVAPSHVEA